MNIVFMRQRVHCTVIIKGAALAYATNCSSIIDF